MVRNFERKTDRSKWSESDKKNALEHVRTKKLSIRKAANQFNIPKITLERHLNSKVKQPGKAKLGSFVPTLDEHFEAKLVKHAQDLEKMLFGLNSDTLRSLAFDLAVAII